MADIIGQAFNEISARTSLNPDIVRYCLECAIAKVVCDAYEMFDGIKIYDCDVDLDRKTVVPIRQVGNSLDLYEAETLCRQPFCHQPPVYNDLIPHVSPFKIIPDSFIADILETFRLIVQDVRAFELQKKWRRNVHQAVEGVIEAGYPDRIEVNLGDDARGVMYKRQWTPLEKASYREGKLFFFYVLQVVRPNSKVHVLLSRGSIGLPGAILKTMAPWVKTKPIKRLRGRKTWLRVSPPVTVAVLKEVSARLNGEVVEIAKD